VSLAQGDGRKEFVPAFGGEASRREMAQSGEASGGRDYAEKGGEHALNLASLAWL
jgi:hypothetical protein